MTVSTTTSSVSYSANGTQTTFAYTFKIFEDSDLLVILRNDTTGVETTQTLTTDYTVTGAGSELGGNVVFGTAPADGNTVFIRRNVPATQLTDYVENDSFPAEAHENALDKLTMLVQQNTLDEDRAILFPQSDVGSGLTNILPSAVARASTFLTFDGSGNVTTTSVSDPGAPSSITKQNFTGTGSQTVFTLAADPGGAGTGVSIYIDGVYQNRDTYSISGTSLTFTEAPPLDASIEYLSYRITSIGSTVASAVTYTPSGTGAEARTVASKLGEFVSVKDFGAVGDGVTDDTTAVTNAMNAASGKVLDGANQTYKVTSAISVTSENITIQNMTIDTSDTSGSLNFITFAGTLGTPTNLTANAVSGAGSVTVASTSGFAADGYAYIASNAIFSTSGSVVLGQIVKIASIDSATQMTLYDDVLYSFNTADSATIAPITTKKNITFRNVKFVGADDTVNNQTALKFTNCSNVTLDNCSFDYYSYTAVTLDRCINSKIINSSARFARKAGSSYGFAINNGCYSVSIDSCYGEDTRHLVTVGDNDGVNLFIRVSNCHAASQRDAGIDAHAACDFMTVDGNTVECVANAADGIIFQGLNCNITDNIVVGNITMGIRVQNWVNDVGTASAVITGNSINNLGNASTNAGIYIDYGNAGGDILNGCTISNNIVDGSFEFGIYVYNSTGTHILQGVAIHNNILRNNAANAGIYLRTASGGTIVNTTISGNIPKSTATNGIYLQGGSANEIVRSAITGNVLYNTSYGVRLINVQDCVVSGNINNSTQRVLATTSTGVVLDQSQSVPTTMTNITYTVTEDDQDLIANRAGTITVTLPTASEWAGRVLNIKTVQAQAVDSASSNVVPIANTGTSTTILTAVDGSWAQLRSDGTNWIVMQKG